MTDFLQKYQIYCEHFNEAVSAFEDGKLAEEVGLSLTARMQLEKHWYYLLLAEAAIYHRQSTARQKEAQKLWQQRGLLERTLANMRMVTRDGSIKLHRAKEFVAAVDELYEQIRHNKKLMSTISARIPKL